MDPTVTPMLLPALATAAAYILVFMGLRTKRLESRHRHRACPSCHRDTRACVCGDV